MKNVILGMAILATSILAPLSASDVKYMPIFVEPYYNSEGPIIKAGPLSKDLMELSEENYKELIEK